jgi:peptidoglycan/xylan/chitin deacetylase (PgdA/CDA1 family)
VEKGLKGLKRQVLRATKRVGLLESVADSSWRRERLLILCYHSLAMDQEHLWRRPLYFTAEEFAQRLQLIQRWKMNVLPLGQAVQRLVSGTLPPRSVVLTFDDGSADFSLLAWPLLRRYGYPATVYVTTYYSEKRLPIFHLMCSYLLWLGRDRTLAAAPELGIPAATNLATSTQRAAVEREILDRAHQDRLDAEEKNTRAAELASLLSIDYGDLLRRRVLHLMTPEELRQVSDDGADVQLHTHRHRVPRQRESFEREIVDNRTRLERFTGRPAEHFCYPSGEHHPEFLPWLAEQHVRTATTTVARLAGSDVSPLLLPRIVDTTSSSPLEIEGWLSGFSQVLPRRRSK